MLCSVMLDISMSALLRLEPPSLPLLSSMRSHSLSPKKSSAPPPRKPSSEVSHTFISRLSASSIAGDSRLQKDAAVMTPAAKPSMASSAFLIHRPEEKDQPRAQSRDPPGEERSQQRLDRVRQVQKPIEHLITPSCRKEAAGLVCLSPLLPSYAGVSYFASLRLSRRFLCQMRDRPRRSM